MMRGSNCRNPFSRRAKAWRGGIKRKPPSHLSRGLASKPWSLGASKAAFQLAPWRRRLHVSTSPAKPAAPSETCAAVLGARPHGRCTCAPRLCCHALSLACRLTLSAHLIVSPVRTGLPHQAVGAARTERDFHAPRAALAAEIERPRLLRVPVVKELYELAAHASGFGRCVRAGYLCAARAWSARDVRLGAVAGACCFSRARAVRERESRTRRARAACVVWNNLF